MASVDLYPPIADTYVPAFVVNANGINGTCKLSFVLSKLSNVTKDKIKSIHVSVIKQTNGKSVIYKVNDTVNKRYRASGILIYNFDSIDDLYDADTDKYNFSITSKDIRDNGSEHNTVGWSDGGIYKIQIRLSTKAYDPSVPQTNWLVQNASSFSEWSAYCTTKAIPQPIISCSASESAGSQTNYGSTLLEYNATYSNADLSETLYSYHLSLFDGTTLIEKSDEQYSNLYTDKDTIHYSFKTELKDGKTYRLVLNYTTKNLYNAERFYFYKIVEAPSANPGFSISSVEKDSTISSSVYNEEEDGRILLKITKDSSSASPDTIVVKRASGRDNFSTWEDIAEITYDNFENKIIYDYSAESGIWYKYAIQTITNNTKSTLNVYSTPILRDFEFTFLLGEDNKQLALKFNNEMGSYKYTVKESSLETIGSQFPFVTRSGNCKYRQFPVSGLISFNMDENRLFFTEEELYKYKDISDLYKDRRNKQGISLYDNILERDFREKVLAFLQDGKPKLFKSPTEGNVLIRLVDIACSPNQSLSRLVYSFSGSAIEVAESTVENYKKYKLI